MLSGSFIYAHPPDYRGRPTLHFSVAEWRALFRELKELGLDTVIWQASAWLELEECYYPSKAMAGFKQWNVVGPMIEAVNAEGMTLYLGTFGVLNRAVSLGVLDGDIGKAVEVAERELKCYQELLNLYGGGFHGYYLSTEVGYSPRGNPRHYAHYGIFFERITQCVKELSPEIKILASPAVAESAGHEAEAMDRLLECFGRAHVDIFAPMDCIGQVSDLGMLEANLGVWKGVCKATGAEFWVNCESFLISDLQGCVVQIEAADPKRFLYQLTVADRLGAKKLVTWEAMHFMDPHGAPKSQALRQAYLRHCASVRQSRGISQVKN